MGQIKIRRACRSDSAALTEFWDEVKSVEKGVAFFTDLDGLQWRFENPFFENGGAIWVAEEEQKIIGHLAASPCPTWPERHSGRRPASLRHISICPGRASPVTSVATAGRLPDSPTTKRVSDGSATSAQISSPLDPPRGPKREHPLDAAGSVDH